MVYSEAKSKLRSIFLNHFFASDVVTDLSDQLPSGLEAVSIGAMSIS